MIEMSPAIVAADALLHQLEEHTATARALCRQVSDMSFVDIGRHLASEPEYKGAERVTQIFSGVFFTGLAIWLLFTNGTKLAFVQRAALEKRLTVCCFINTYIAVFSSFFNFFQLTGVDDIALARRTSFNLDLARPFEWIVTCPMMQVVLVLMGGSRIPEYRRMLMPFLSALGLGLGTAAMLIEEDFRYAFFGASFAVALLMWYLNAKQIEEHSNGEENLLKGDSEFRKASVLLISTWFPFPGWFLLSPEGIGLIDDVLIIQVGWAFLNIVAKFTFIFYIQRIKDNYCNRLKAKREMYGMTIKGPGAIEDGSLPQSATSPALTGGQRVQGELNAVVMETMTFLGMAQHTDRFSRLLRRAQITSLEMVERLTKDQCEELQLPWDLVSALQRRIQVWSLEMRDTAEDELEKGEIHYNEAEATQKEEERLHSLVPNTVPSEDRQERFLYGVPTRGMPTHGLLTGGVGGPMHAFGNVAPGLTYQTGDVHMKNVDARLDKLEGLLEKQDRFTQKQEEFMNVMLQRQEGAQQQQMLHVSEVEGNLRRRLDFMEGQIITSVQTSMRCGTPPTAAWNSTESPLQVAAPDVGSARRLEEMIMESSDRLVEKNEKLMDILERNLQSKSDRQQNELESSLFRKLEEMFVRGHERFEHVLHTKLFETNGMRSKVTVAELGDRDIFEANSQMLQKIVMNMNQLEVGQENIHNVQNLLQKIAMSINQLEIGQENMHNAQNKLITSVNKLDSTQENVHNVQTRRTNEVFEKMTTGLTQLELSQEKILRDMQQALSRSDQMLEAVRSFNSHSNASITSEIQTVIHRSDQLIEMSRESAQSNRETRDMVVHRSDQLIEMSRESAQSNRETRDMVVHRSDQLIEMFRESAQSNRETRDMVVHRSDQLIEMSRESAQSNRETRDMLCSVRELLGRNSPQNNAMLDAIRSALQTDMDTLLGRSDAILSGVNDGRDFQKESNADLRRHSMLILEQVSETKERAHMNTGQLAEIQRSVMEQTMRFMRGMTDLGMSMPLGMSTGQDTGQDRPAVNSLSSQGVVMVPAPVPVHEQGSPRFAQSQASPRFDQDHSGNLSRPGSGRRMPVGSAMSPTQTPGQQPQMGTQMQQMSRDSMM